ncbi:MAG: hypothetical protein CVU84_08935 [Firmicutes bacterium HGW-Firmicutes-1]|jgi:ferredoxin|nr:MAG: hypothetical protein CVU84_08935 [Firmicutes bacterium HGW-Firmicutes-1]
MSKNIIYYFSGTGNSLSIAMELAEKLGEAALIPVLSIDSDYMISSEVETVGLVYPIYMNATPQIIQEFISRIKFEKNCYVYAIATHGGIPGKAGCHLHKVLKDENISLKAYFEICMINNTPKGVAPKFLMNLDWEKEIAEDKVIPILQQSIEEIQSIVSFIQSRDTSSIEVLQAKEKGFQYWIMKQLWKVSGHSKPKLQFLLGDGCIGCGICEKVCTTNRIKLSAGKPYWEGEKCHYCYACFNFCPVQVIGVKYYTKKLGRYHHPDVGWEDVAAQKHLQ